MAVTDRAPEVRSENRVRAPRAQDARQGRNVSGMVSVLVISLVLILLAYGVFIAFFSGQTDPSPAADIASEPNAIVSPGPAPPPSQPPQ